MHITWASAGCTYGQKLNLYGPLVEALGHYSDSGWSVKILPWVVGAWGLVLERAKHHALEYIEVPKSFWRPKIEDTVLASISALAFMHRIRLSPPALVQLSEAINLSLQINSMKDFLLCGAKRKNGSMHEGLDTTMARWKRMVGIGCYPPRTTRSWWQRRYYYMTICCCGVVFVLFCVMCVMLVVRR